MIYAIVLLLVCIMLAQVYNIIKRSGIEKEKKYLEQVVHSDKQQYQELMDANKKLRQINHDLQKYMNVVCTLAGEGESGEVHSDYIIHMIVDDKEREAKEAGVEFHKCIAENIPCRMKISDLIRLLINILDNAAEAAQRAETNRFIQVDISMGDSEGSSRIAVRNSKRISERPLENDMSTTKDDRENHGYGMAIVREIAEKYGGKIDLRDEGNEFILSVNL